MRKFLFALGMCLVSLHAWAGVRIKDITALHGSSDSQLIGYGLVVGLQGTGDTLRNVPFAEQSLQSMLDRMGLNVRGNSLRSRDVAAVMVTAELPPGASAGSRIDVTVSALGDSTSLMGGTLLLSTLAGIDTQIYATAQGPVSVTGFEAAGQAETLSQGVPTAGHISNGALVGRQSPPAPDEGTVLLELKNPDDATVIRVVDAINAYARQRYGHRVAFEQDTRSIAMVRPPQISRTRFMAEIGELTVIPDSVARVVVDARTGTVVIGQDVQISTVAVTHGTLTVRVNETPTVSQPGPLSFGKTVVTPQTKIDVNQSGGQVAIIGGTSLRTLVAGLNRIGLKPTGIIAILQAIKTAGALQAELVVQ
jgi:flagellar P-ring protein precursor FlgI